MNMFMDVPFWSVIKRWLQSWQSRTVTIIADWLQIKPSNPHLYACCNEKKENFVWLVNNLISHNITKDFLNEILFPIGSLKQRSLFEKFNKIRKNVQDESLLQFH